MSDGSAEGSGEMSMLCRLLLGAKIARIRLTFKLELREEITVEGAAVEDEFKNGVQGRGGRCG